MRKIILSKRASNRLEELLEYLELEWSLKVKNDFIKKLKKNKKTFVTISVAKLIAQTIDNLHNGDSVSDLWKN